jgi:hypothetical protein
LELAGEYRLWGRICLERGTDQKSQKIQIPNSITRP